MLVVNIKSRQYVILLFGLYIMTVLFLSCVDIELLFSGGLIIFQPLIDVSHNLIPLTTIKTYLFNFHSYNFDIWFYNTVGNILLFIPMGALLPILLTKIKKFFFPTVTIIVFFSLTVETVQYASKLGVFDVDDITLNILGGFIGFLIFILFKNWKKSFN
ncbi:hypothetical protein GI584_15035 [Gracilibacillus salitolerans]|uniref:VanZ-like domain-containing protein n=1 Tax=Gracilibacillus salitolerans TaxID=2663022 RepID=A0A5Q2TK26_9BACI|nr:VanZ family protein [Gracilibacillus salitolerans]QGH35284.1 hypothetical protein GI584_15035 [Gracilibacillus salitolerans]